MIEESESNKTKQKKQKPKPEYVSLIKNRVMGPKFLCLCPSKERRDTQEECHLMMEAEIKRMHVKNQ